MSKVEKWIDLSSLPRDNRNRINWKNSMGYKCEFKYDNIEGEVKIVDYTSKEQKLTIKYLDYDLFEIHTDKFKGCNFGKLLKKKTSEFKVEIGLEIKDNKRDLVIINREYRIKKRKNGSIENCKYYNYHCNKCNNEDWMVESDLITHNNGCNICNASNPKPKLGFNTIYDTDYWIIELGVSEEDAKKYTPQSHNKIKVKCPYCGKEKYKTISDIYNDKSIGCICGDGISYPEKFVISLLDQLNINYIKEYSSYWTSNKRYDFYFKLNNKKYIIETHGRQHYNSGFNNMNGRTLQEERDNDRCKKELALNNGIDFYIELDCRKSELEWIRNNVINSELNKIFDLNKVNWLKCEEFALSNRVKEVCDYWHFHNEINNEGLTTFNLGVIFNTTKNTIIYYLKKGATLKWCRYNPKEEIRKSGFRSGKINSKNIEIFDKNGQSLGIFSSCSELERQSEEFFGVKLLQGNISMVARGERKKYKGYIFKYV